MIIADDIPYEMLDQVRDFLAKAIEPEKNVHVRGTSKKVTAEQIESAATFYLRRMLPRLHKKVRVFVKLARSKALAREWSSRSDDGLIVHGFCTWLDSNHRPREFEIYINGDLSAKTILTALAHEIVHVKQWATGELKEYITNRPEKWRGVDYTDGNYYEFPWEIDAYENESVLYEEYMVNAN